MACSPSIIKGRRSTHSPSGLNVERTTGKFGSFSGSPAPKSVRASVITKPSQLSGNLILKEESELQMPAEKSVPGLRLAPAALVIEEYRWKTSMIGSAMKTMKAVSYACSALQLPAG